MKTKILTIVIAAIFIHVVNNGLYAQQNKTNDHLSKNIIYFGYDRPDLTLQAISSLDKIINTLESHPIYTIEVYGHADSDGTLPYNFELSDRRTRSVSQHLISNGIVEMRISTNHFGETKPIAANDTDEGKAKNRRVEVVIKYEPINEGPVIYTSSDNIFYINNDKDAVLIGLQGTRITIPANSLITESGNEVTGNVKVELKEVFTKKDMILSGLTTVTTEGNLLESGGMFYINATVNSQRLKFKEGKSIELQIPIDEIKEGMQLYKKINSCSDWKLLRGKNILYKSQKYILRIGGFGWFNIDRAIPMPDLSRKLIVKISKNEDLSFVNGKMPILFPCFSWNDSYSRLIFNEKNSIMFGAYINNKKIKFNGLKAGDHITLIIRGYSNEDKITYYAIKEHVIKRKLFPPFRRKKVKNLEFKQMTSEELDQSLAGL